MITAIAACDDNFGIGKDGDIPWCCAEDTKYFKEITSGGIVIMGSKTWHSIPERYRPLPGRQNIIISRHREVSYGEDGEYYTNDPRYAMLHSMRVSWRKTRNICIIGGETIYEALLDYCDRILLTRIPGDYQCDTFFPTKLDMFWEVQNKIPLTETVYVEDYRVKVS